MKYTPLEQRFSEMITKGATPDDCWSWAGTKTDGYGMIRSGRGGRMVLAHRVSYQLSRGPIPDGICVLHKCDNPPCTNPEHLFLGTRADNNADKAAKGRWRGGCLLGEANPAAKLTWGQVAEIRASGLSQSSIAKTYGVDQKTISLIKRGITWNKRILADKPSKRPMKSSGRKMPSRPFQKRPVKD